MTVATNEQRAARVAVDLTRPLAGLDEAYRMAQALAQSALMPPDLRNKPNDVLVVALYGRELGIGPLQAAQVIQVIKGKPFIAGQLWAALVRRAGHKLKVTGDNQSATATITRSDDLENPHTETFTMDDARTAKLIVKDGNWDKYPSRMLRWRAVANAARLACPEVALGFAMLEERDDEPAGRPTLAEVARERDDVDKDTGEIHDAEVVDDDAVRAEVEQLGKANEPTGDIPLDMCTTCGAVGDEPHDQDEHARAESS